MKFKYLALLGAFLFAISIGASAQASRTWVSGVGDDANPCSRTAPCKTFAGSISKTAANGEIDCLDNGGFGAVTITKGMTIDCTSNAGGISTSFGNGVNISAGLSDVVTLRNLHIVCSASCGSGVQVNNAKAVHLQNVDINTFTNGVQVASPTTVFMDFSSVRDCTANGFNMAPSGIAYAEITESRFENNLNGVVANDYAKITVISSQVSGNSNAGFLAQGTAGSATLNLISCGTSFNTVAGVQAINNGSLATVRLSGTSFTSNGLAISTTGTVAVLSFQNNPISGTGAPTGTIPLQ